MKNRIKVVEGKKKIYCHIIDNNVDLIIKWEDLDGKRISEYYITGCHSAELSEKCEVVTKLGSILKNDWSKCPIYQEPQKYL